MRANSLSYFNEMAGGPENGAAHLLDANIDWGQDLLELKRWCDAHPEARPLYLGYFGTTFVDPGIANIEFEAILRPGNRDNAPIGRRKMKLQEAAPHVTDGDDDGS